MKYIKQMLYYAGLFLYVFTLDRITKWWALRNLDQVIQINDFLSFEFVINRGISWSMFHSESNSAFYLLTFVIIGVTLFLASYAYQRWHDDKFILGEVIILAGGISNIVDRIMYGGVIDFIALNFGIFSWPVFNLADAFIVLGVLFMLVTVYKDND